MIASDNELFAKKKVFGSRLVRLEWQPKMFWFSHSKVGQLKSSK